MPAARPRPPQRRDEQQRRDHDIEDQLRLELDGLARQPAEHQPGSDGGDTSGNRSVASPSRVCCCCAAYAMMVFASTLISPGASERKEEVAQRRLNIRMQVKLRLLEEQ